jgi:hypothetical protein
VAAPFNDGFHDLPGLGDQAVAVLEWTGIGAGAGALLPVGLMLGVGLGMIAAILRGLGQLLNFLTSP